MTGFFFWDWLKHDDDKDCDTGTKTPPATDTRDGYVEGSTGNDVIAAGYTDSDGDKIDAGDALLPGETGDDDIVIAGGGNDSVSSGKGDDEVYGGGGNDTVMAGSGDDVIYGDEVRDSAPTTSSSKTFDCKGLWDYDKDCDKWFDWGNLSCSKLGSHSSYDNHISLSLDKSCQLKGLDFDGASKGGYCKIYGHNGKVLFEGKISAKLDLNCDGATKIDVWTNHGCTLTGVDYASGGFDGIDAGEPGEDYLDGGMGDDTIFGNAKDDTIKGQHGNDELYGNSGDDLIEGGAGNDLIYGDDGATGGSTGGSGERESFEWDKAPDPNGSGAIDNGDNLAGGFTQNTGSVDVTFKVKSTNETPSTKFQTDTQKVHSITTDGTGADAKSSMASRTNSDDESATYEWGFSSTVGNVSFRINDIDADSKVVIKAYDVDGNLVDIDVRAESGTHLTLKDLDGAGGKEVITHDRDDLGADTDPAHSVLVNIAGPIARLEITHEQNGHDTSEINVTDIYFDALEGDTGGAGSGVGNDTILAGSGDDTVYGNGGDDSIDGGKGNDVLYGDNGGAGGAAGGARESFNWQEVSQSQADATVTQDTGSVNVTYTRIKDTGSHESSIDNATKLNTSGIDSDGETVDSNSALRSETHGRGNEGDFQWEFSEAVTDVNFNINDLDTTGRVNVKAWGPDGQPITVTLVGGSGMVLADTDAVAGNDQATSTRGDVSEDAASNNLQISIAGPVSKIVVEHTQVGSTNSGIWITDMYFTAPAGDGDSSGESGNDVINGGEGADMMYGEGGDDTFVIGSAAEGAGDVVVGGNGSDETSDIDTLDLRGAGKVTITQEADDTDAGSTKGTVTFADGSTLTFSQIETILTDPQDNDPFAEPDTAVTDEDTSVTIDVLDNDEEPDGDPLTIISVTDPANGTAAIVGGEIVYTPNPDFNGIETISYTVSDPAGNTDTATITITVNPVNDAPVAADDAATTDEDTTVTIDVLANDSDVDGDPLSIVGTPVSAEGGTVTVNPDGTIDYTPPADFTGTDTITYTVTDPDGLTDTATVTVTVGEVNDAPIAEDDVVTVDEDTTTTLDPLANDSDPDGDPLSIVGTPVSAEGGTVTVNPDGTIDYTPPADFNGTDTITYTVTDPDGATDTATITVTVNPINDAPVAVDDADTTDEDTSVTIDVLGNDTDVDGDLLTISAVGTPANGTAEIVDGKIVYTPNPGFDGTDSFTYTITDPDGLTDTATVTVTVEDVVPERDGIVEGTSGDDLIDDDYTGDPEGDMVDNEDALDPTSGDDDLIEAYSGDDTVIAGSGDDTVYGGDGDDDISGNSGDDEIYGEDGNDTIDGGSGDDTIDAGKDGRPDKAAAIPGVDDDTQPDDDLDLVYGGAGNDSISTGDDADTIYGGSGNDTLNPGIDDDLVYGGSGDDSVNDIQGSDEIYGGDGDDTLIAGIDTFSDYEGDDPNLPNPLYPGALSDPDKTDGMDTVYGGKGNDVIMTGDDADDIYGGSGDDTINAGIDDDYVEGGEGNDSIIGGHGSDTIYGQTGDDWINAGDSTLLWGQSPDDDPVNPDPVPENGRDLVYGGDGNDTIFGQDDDDTIYGGEGNDVIDAGIDDDEVYGNSGDDVLIGGQGDDTMDGNQGDDSLEGGSGDDSLEGGQGDDTILGDEGDDTLRGNQGADSLVGGSGEDSIDGGAGNDTITGGDGADKMFGGNDRDVFLGSSVGDEIDGGSGGDDYDILDLRGSAPTGGRINVIYEANPENGTVEFYDADDQLVGTSHFEEIEKVIPCFTPGTLIATPRGEVPVESLKEGDRVITRDNGIQEIRWMGAKGLTGRELLQKEHLKPVLIQKGSLGYGLPERDMLVSPNHRVLVNNDKTALYFEEREVLVAAKHLTGLAGVNRVDTMKTTYIHFMFDQHEVVLSDGSWTESFQPGHQTLDGLGNAQRQEILELFPELATEAGREDYHAARRTLKKHEAKLLTK